MPFYDSLTQKIAQIGQKFRGQNAARAGKKRLMEATYAVQVQRLRQDVGKWRDALNRAENVYYPDRTQLLNIYSDLVLDLHLTSVMETRKINVMSRPFKLVDKAGKENVELTKLLKKPWFRKFAGHALDKIFYGYSLLEFPLPVDGEFQGVELIPRQYVFPEAGLVRTMPGMITGVSYLEDPSYAPWVIAVGEVNDLGLLNKCAPMGLFKKNVMAAWADFTEVFGMPFRSVSTDAEGDELDRIEEIVAGMGQSSWGVFPEDTKVEFIQAATANEQLYNVFIDRCNSELSKAVLGQTMTTDNGSSKSQGEVHERVAQAYTREDSEFLAELVNYTLLPFLIKHGYKLEGYTFEWDLTESLGKEAQWKIVNDVIQRGYKVPADYITSTFGIPVEVEAAAGGDGGQEGGGKPGPTGKGGAAPDSVDANIKPILGYHIDAGVVTKNEARAQLGLAAENDPEADKQQKLRAKLAVLAAATGAGIPLEAALKLADLTEVKVPEPAPTPSPQGEGVGGEVEQGPGGPGRNRALDKEELPGKSKGRGAEVTAALAQLYHGPACSCCAGALGSALRAELVTNAATDGGELEAIIDRLINLVWAGKGALEEFLDMPLFNYLDTFLQDAVSIAWNAPDPKLRAHLVANVQHFAGFKTYQVQQEMTRKLFDLDGLIVDFEAFKKEALLVNQLYNVDYLKAEYELAVAGAQMASKWSDFEPTALLQYRTVGDDLVRPEHVAFDNITLPANHSWWLSHYPPNGWRCRCDAVEVGDDYERTPENRLNTLPEVPKMFARNVGLTGEVFGQEHPYFDVPAKTAGQITQAITKSTKPKPKK